jgi:ribose transport system ATP-binding protein
LASASAHVVDSSHEALAASALSLRGIVKTFPGVRALRGVDFTCARGEIHALLGENGAGKSTLVNVASGNLAADEGEVRIGDATLDVADPAAARPLGLAITYQDDSLIPDLSVAENLVLGVPEAKRPTGARLQAWTREQLERFGTEIERSAPVRELPVAARQIVEIVKALVAQPAVLILDEPTAALTSVEADRLHAILRDVAAQGTGVVYITHRLVEVVALADRVSVLRDGEMVARDVPRSDVDQDRLVELMVGRALDTTFPPKAVVEQLGDTVLSANDISGGGFNGVLLEVRAGEIVGFAGVEGNGQREALRALAGLEPRDGRVEVRGHAVRSGHVRSARRAGMTFVSGDRRGEGVFPELSVRDNMTAGSLNRIERGGIITRRREQAAIVEHLEMLALRTPSIEHSVGSLSGGNQQKVALGRALLERPNTYLIEEPTQGVDAATRLQIYRLLRQEAARGATVVVLSSDALELAGLCDRVLVFSRGHVVAELEGEGLDEQRIVGASARSDARRVETAVVARRGSIVRWAQRSDFAPVSLLALSIAILMLLLGGAHADFLSADNLTNIMFLAVPLGFAALAQAVVMLTGGIDLSVGPVVSLTTVVIAGLMKQSDPGSTTALALVAALAVGLTLGLVNALLVRRLKLQPLIATLATYVIVQGLALLWMSTPGGYVSEGFASGAGQLIGFIPIAFIALVAVSLGGEYIYRRRIAGLSFRAVGSRPAAARRLGVRSEAVYYGAYMFGGLLGAVAGIFFIATIQIGDPTLGIPFTLASVTAVVLGGMSTWGGRGSLLGAVAGAVLLAVIANGAQSMNYPPEVQYYIQGGLLIGAIALYSKLRSSGRMRDETLGER